MKKMEPDNMSEDRNSLKTTDEWSKKRDALMIFNSKFRCKRYFTVLPA